MFYNSTKPHNSSTSWHSADTLLAPTGNSLSLFQTNGVCTLPPATPHSGLLQRWGLGGGVMPGWGWSQHDVGVGTLHGTLDTFPPSIAADQIIVRTSSSEGGWMLPACLSVCYSHCCCCCCRCCLLTEPPIEGTYAGVPHSEVVLVILML